MLQSNHSDECCHYTSFFRVAFSGEIHGFTPLSNVSFMENNFLLLEITGCPAYIYLGNATEDHYRIQTTSTAKILEWYNKSNGSYSMAQNEGICANLTTCCGHSGVFSYNIAIQWESAIDGSGNRISVWSGPLYDALYDSAVLTYVQTDSGPGNQFRILSRASIAVRQVAGYMYSIHVNAYTGNKMYLYVISLFMLH